MLSMTINTVGTLNLSTEFGALFVFSAFIETLDFFSQVRTRLCKLQKGCTRLAAASDKVYQLLVHGRWFSPGTLPPLKLVAMI
jgi:hypothetical protein